MFGFLCKSPCLKSWTFRLIFFKACTQEQKGENPEGPSLFVNYLSAIPKLVSRAQGSSALYVARPSD